MKSVASKKKKKKEIKKGGESLVHPLFSSAHNITTVLFP